MTLLTLWCALVTFYDLGSRTAPETFWASSREGEGIVFDFGTVVQVGSFCFYGGIGESGYSLDLSQDGHTWSAVTSAKKKFPFQWLCAPLGLPGRLARFTVAKERVMIGEIAFFASGSDIKPLPVALVSPLSEGPAPVGTIGGNRAVTPAHPSHLIDEQDRAASHASYRNSFYFDEVHFARAAYEYLHGLPFSENTHPPLGKLLIAAGIFLSGMNPFGWRVAGALAGTAIVPMAYLFGRRLFHHTWAAFFSAFLMSVDFMRIAQARMGTMDSFLVLFILCSYYFMYRYTSLNLLTDPIEDTLKPLTLSGLFFGLSVSVKWSGLFAGLGLALIFFAYLFASYRQYRTLRNHKRPRKKKGMSPSSDEIPLARSFFLLAGKTVVWAALIFIVLPALVYALCYAPLMIVERTPRPLACFIDAQRYMYSFHFGLKAEHPFSSAWWEWPLMRRPLWMYYDFGQGKKPERISSIVSMGNPALWWIGSLSVLPLTLLWLGKRDGRAFFILAGILPQYVPWMGVSRLTFVYHFFPVVPFLAFAATYVVLRLKEHWPRSVYAAYIYLTVCLVLFILFYPILSGMEVSKEYVAQYLRWFKKWIFFT